MTGIEVLSPTNKQRGSVGWDIYLRKRRKLLTGAANLVELDLVRGGQRIPMSEPWATAPYTFLIARQDMLPRCLVWPAHFRTPLPNIPVPLARPDPDAQLNLQAMIESIYTDFRYYRSIDYTKPLVPALGSEDRAWLEGQLRERQQG